MKTIASLAVLGMALSSCYMSPDRNSSIPTKMPDLIKTGYWRGAKLWGDSNGKYGVHGFYLVKDESGKTERVIGSYLSCNGHHVLFGVQYSGDPILFLDNKDFEGNPFSDGYLDGIVKGGEIANHEKFAPDCPKRLLDNVIKP
jgi:hypothetical protein